MRARVVLKELKALGKLHRFAVRALSRQRLEHVAHRAHPRPGVHLAAGHLHGIAAAVDAFVRALATELGPGGVRVNTVAPGLTLTDAAYPMSPGDKATIAARCPMRRNGVPEDMAGAVLFFASELSRFMTGAYVPIDGGATMV